jgi:hypothetical protein
MNYITQTGLQTALNDYYTKSEIDAMFAALTPSEEPTDPEPTDPEPTDPEPTDPTDPENTGETIPDEPSGDNTES